MSSTIYTLIEGKRAFGISVDNGLRVLYASERSAARVWKVFLASASAKVVAGTGVSGYNGDNILATKANLNRPDGLAVSPSGELLIADSYNHRIRKVGADGKIHTVAGTGIAGYQGDGDLATKARLNYPAAVATDQIGNLFIADTENNCVRLVSALTGLISTIAKAKEPAMPSLEYPVNLCVDADGCILIGDEKNLYKAKPDGTDISHVPLCYGTHPEIKASVGGITVDQQRHIFRTAADKHVVFQQAGTAKADVIAGQYEKPGCSGEDVPPTEALLNKPGGLCLTTTGDLIIADTDNELIRVVEDAAEAAGSVTLSIDRAQVEPDEVTPNTATEVTLSWHLACKGEATARAVTLVVDLPKEVTFESASHAQAQVSADGRWVTVPLGGLPPGEPGQKVTVRATVTAQKGPVPVPAYAASTTPDSTTGRPARTAELAAIIAVSSPSH